MKQKYEYPNKDLSDFSIEDLASELAHRRAQAISFDMFEAEQTLSAQHDQDRDQAFAAYLLRLSQSQDSSPKTCPRCGARSRIRARRRKRKIRTMTGEHILERNQHYCEGCKLSFYPLDIEIGLSEEGEASPDLERRILDFGVTTTFKESEERWSVHYNMPISENFVRCVVERSQRVITSAKIRDVQEVIRPRPSKPAELLVIQTDGGMIPTRGAEPWKESKLGVIYREDNHLASSKTERGCITEARYVAHLGGVESFKEHILEALGVEEADKAQEIVWLGDGAHWNWNMADELAPTAIQILDPMHAIEHASNCAKILFNNDDIMVKMWVERVKFILYQDKPSVLLLELRGCRIDATQAQQDAIDDLLRYYSNNIERMNYLQFRARGLPIGSGAVESGHKHVIQKRMKLAGQHWEISRGRGMVELRAAYRTTGPVRLHSAIRLLKQRTFELGRRAA
jgi:hypothetical protein